MARTDPSPPRGGRSLLALVLAISVLFAIVLRPLAGALSWALFLAIVFSALQERSVEVCRGRRGWAAFGSLVVIVVSVILPAALLALSLSHEAASFYERVRSGEVQFDDTFRRAMASLPGWAQQAVGRLGIDDFPALQRKAMEGLGRSSQQLTAQAFTIGQNTLDFVINFFVMLYVLYFLLRDGPQLSARVARSLPLAPEQTQRLLRQFAIVVRATVKGNVVIALAQGTLGWMAFAFIGIPGALLWGAAMALLSLLPAVGSALVWVPIAIWLGTTGQVPQAIGLVAWSVLVIGLVDNLLRPILVGKQTRLPDWLVLVATFGGLSAFGPNGFVLGPVVAAIFLAAWEIYAQERAAVRAAQATTYTPAPTDSSLPPGP